ncbi:Putative sensor [Actinoalloteichus hymeniacidonis]|uniref:Sensor n=1 Tax=Actinoalloteichus hymeniacidonis TaxID=340345 RepID=A0AAC9HVR7_9PSEU|nr:Putative sensor [Actinoalloteichus hymeniacidonis]
MRKRLTQVLRATSYSLTTLCTFPAAVLGFCLLLVSVALIPVGVGIVATPAVLVALRWLSNLERRRAGRYLGTPVEARPLSLGGGITGLRQAIADPSSLRDAGWTLVQFTAVTLAGVLALAMAAVPFLSIALLGTWQLFPEPISVFAGIEINNWLVAATLLPAQAIGIGALGLLVVPLLAKIQAEMSRNVLASTAAQPARGLATGLAEAGARTA